jgi:hypothetical protein
MLPYQDSHYKWLHGLALSDSDEQAFIRTSYRVIGKISFSPRFPGEEGKISGPQATSYWLCVHNRYYLC